MEWLDDFINGFSNAADQVGTFLSSVGTDLGDAVDSISKAFSNSAPTTADQGGNAFNGPIEVVGNKTEAPGLLDRIESFATKRPKTLEMIGQLGAGYVGAQQKEAAAEKLAQSRLNELQEADRLKRERAAQYSSSVSGLARPGLMAQKPLTRVGGARVFGSNGLMSR